MSEFLYGYDAGKDMPAEFLTSHAAWDDFISGIWSAVLSDTKFDENISVLEIGPGVSTKIGGALAKIGFCGELYVVDPLEGVLEVLKSKYKALLPNAKVTYISKPLSDAYADLPSDVDLILGSHVLDDIMVYHGAASALDWAKEYTHQPSADLKTSWQSILEDTDKLSLIKKSVIEDILDMYERLKPEAMILNQYPSATLNDHDMESLNLHAFDILRKLAERLAGEDIQNVLNTFPHYKNKHIGAHVLNAKYWLLCKKK